MDEERQQYEIKVYKIWYEDAPEDFYIGSTKLSLSRRMVDHRHSARRGNKSLIYRTMREKGVNDFQYVLLGSCMVCNMDEQRAFEQEHISRLNPSMNMNRAFRTEEDAIMHRRAYEKIYKQRPEYKEYRKNYKQRSHVKEYDRIYQQTPARKEYHQKYSKEYLTDKQRTCVCGGTYHDLKHHANRHYSSQRHIDWVTDFYERLKNINA